MEESGTQKIEETKVEGQEPTQTTTPVEPVKTADVTEVKPEPKVFDEIYVKGLRRENAGYRRQVRELQDVVYGNQGQSPHVGQPPVGQSPQQGPIYDPRVDDMLLNNKLNEIKADPYFKELFAEEDEEGRSFEERLLETAIEKSWPIDELDALVFKMEKDKLLGKTKQKGIDEAYNSMKTKAQGAADLNVSSGKNVEGEKVETVQDAVKAAMKEHGVTNLSELR